jgi:hypothetical protein
MIPRFMPSQPPKKLLKMYNKYTNVTKLFSFTLLSVGPTILKDKKLWILILLLRTLEF